MAGGRREMTGLVSGCNIGSRIREGIWMTDLRTYTWLRIPHSSSIRPSEPSELSTGLKRSRNNQRLEEAEELFADPSTECR